MADGERGFDGTNGRTRAHYAPDPDRRDGGPGPVSSVSQLSVKVICVMLMVGCALITITGRGVLCIVQGILGIMFAVEGFWGAVKQDLPIIRKFIMFLVFYVFASVVIGVLNLRTVDGYCTTADPAVCQRVYFEDSRDCEATTVESCVTTAKLYAYLNLFGGCLLVPIFLLFIRVFYNELRYQQQLAEAGVAGTNARRSAATVGPSPTARV